MHKTTLFCLCCCFALFQAAAQTFELGFNPAKPLVFEHPEQDKALFLFMQERTLDNRNYDGKVFLCRADKVDSLRENTVSLRISGYEDPNVRRLCRASRADCAYFALENNDQCRVFRLSWNDLRLEQTDSLPAMKDERFVLGLSNGPHACVVSYWKSKKEGEHLFIYKIDAAGKLQKHDFPISENESDDFERIFKKSYNLLVGKAELRPLSVQYGMEHDPEAAARKPKMFIGDDVVWLAYDAEVQNFSVLKFYTFDLKTNTLTQQKYDYGSGTPMAEAKGASYVYDGKIFQVANSATSLDIAIRDLWTGNVLQHHRYGIDKDSIVFANSPILMPGRGVLGVEKEYDSPKKFLKRFKNFQPSVQVRREGNDYLLCIGGYELVDTRTPGVMKPNGLMVGGGGMVYERACSFYSAVNANNLFRSNVRYERTLASYYADMSQFLDGITDEAILRVGGKHYVGRYVIQGKRYELRKVK